MVLNKTDSIEEHYLANRQKLLKKLTFRAGNDADAEDILQEAYYRALRYCQSYDGSIFGKWFSTILNNALREYKNNQKGIVFDIPYDESYDCPEYTKAILREVYELVDTKSIDQQEVLGYYLHNTYTAVDISRITEHSYAKCSKIISRFREELKQLYGK